jgi:hypothetical protein
VSKKPKQDTDLAQVNNSLVETDPWHAWTESPLCSSFASSF